MPDAPALLTLETVAEGLRGGPLSRQQGAELRKLARMPTLCHWAFAPRDWPLLHRRGFIEVEFVPPSRIRATITNSGQAMLGLRLKPGAADGG